MKDTTPILQHFGLVVKELRREKLLSQEELANRCGLHRTYITDIEHGTRNVSLKNISKIARAVEVPLHDLFGRVERHSNNGVKVSDRLSRLQNIKRSPVEIVLVDDDQEYVELILHEMQKRNIGNTVHAVRSGEEALRFLFDEKSEEHNAAPVPTAILLGLKLPAGSGFDLLERIRKDKRTKDIPVAILTSSMSDADKERCHNLGVDEYLIKPINIDSFASAMRRLGFQLVLMEKGR